MKLDCIFNISINLASKSFYSGVMDPLEFYMDTGLLSPATKMFQMEKLLGLKDIRKGLKRKELRVIGLSQAYKVTGPETGFQDFIAENGGEKPRAYQTNHRFTSVLQDKVMHSLKAKGIDEFAYGCIHLRLGDFADYCKLKPKTWASTVPRNESNDTDDCFISLEVLKKYVSTFSTTITSIAFISNDISLARSMMNQAVAEIGRNLFVFTPGDFIEDKYAFIGAADRIVCGNAEEVILNQYSTFSQDIAGRVRRGRDSISYFGKLEQRVG